MGLRYDHGTVVLADRPDPLVVVDHSSRGALSHAREAVRQLGYDFDGWTAVDEGVYAGTVSC